MRFSLTSARDLVNQGNFGEALQHYLMVLVQVRKNDIDMFAKEFGQCIDCYGSSYECTPVKLHNLVGPVTSLFSKNAYMHALLGLQLAGKGLHTEAYKMMRHFLDKCVTDEERGYAAAVRIVLNNLTTALFDSWHMVMLNNQRRNQYYYDAISKIPHGRIVLEIGSGTGLLSVMAHKRDLDVIAVEESKELVNVTKNTFLQNRKKDSEKRILEVFHCNSSEFEMRREGMAEKADVLITEILDCSAFGEGIIKTYIDAHKRLVDPRNCIFIPRQVIVYATLVQSESLYKIHAYMDYRTEWVTQCGKLPKDPYWCDSLDNYPDLVRLSDAVECLGVNLSSTQELESLIRSSMAKITMITKQKGKIHAIVVHWRAEMTDKVWMESNMEGSCWDYGIYPVLEPKSVLKKQKVSVDVIITHEGKKLSLVLSEERTNKGPAHFATKDQYLSICHDEGFTKEIAVDSRESDESIYVCNPFNWKAIPALNSYYLVQFPFYTEKITKHVPKFGAAVMGKKKFGADGSYTYAIEPPYDRAVFWPFLPDGGFNTEAISVHIPEVVKGWRNACEEDQIPYRSPRVTPPVLNCHAQLVYSNDLAVRCRLQPDSHFGIDVKSPDHMMNLFECRDIRIHNFEHTKMSEEFEPFSLNLQAMFDSPEIYSEYAQSYVIPVECTQDGHVDGVLYWWTGKTIDSRTLPCCAFVFYDRIQVTKGQTVPIRWDFHNGYFLMSIEPTP